jgi:hypothetical protein
VAALPQRDGLLFRFANAHLREYFPNLVSQSQLNRRIRAPEPELKALQHDFASTLSDHFDLGNLLVQGYELFQK